MGLSTLRSHHMVFDHWRVGSSDYDTRSKWRLRHICGSLFSGHPWNRASLDGRQLRPLQRRYRRTLLARRGVRKWQYRNRPAQEAARAVFTHRKLLLGHSSHRAVRNQSQYPPRLADRWSPRFTGTLWPRLGSSCRSGKSSWFGSDRQRREVQGYCSGGICERSIRCTIPARSCGLSAQRSSQCGTVRRAHRSTASSFAQFDGTWRCLRPKNRRYGH